MRCAPLSRLLLPLLFALALPSCTGPEAAPSPKAAASAAQRPAGDAASSIFTFSALPFQGTEPKSLRAYEGQVLLIINTAANCGFTPQMGPLAELDKKYRDRRFRVVGFLSDDFGKQGGTAEEVTACGLKYNATFDEFAHIHVKKGPEQHPLFAYLTSRPGLDADVSWNFNKWLIDRRGQLVARWPSETEPAAAEVTAAIEKELAKP
jgi:glutathione peroxidase